MARVTASVLVRDARLLRRHPISADACERLGTTKVRSLLRQVKPRTEAAFDRDEQLLVDQVEGLTVEDTITLARFWRSRVDEDGAPPRGAEPSESTSR